MRNHFVQQPGELLVRWHHVEAGAVAQMIVHHPLHGPTHHAPDGEGVNRELQVTGKVSLFGLSRAALKVNEDKPCFAFVHSINDSGEPDVADFNLECQFRRERGDGVVRV